jgi:hypothetical protein
MAEDRPDVKASTDKRTTEQRIADLELQLAQTRAGTPGGTIPEHGAGFGNDVEETWSQAEQEEARAEANAPPVGPTPGR